MPKQLVKASVLALSLALCACSGSSTISPTPSASLGASPSQNVLLTKPVLQPLAADGLPTETPHARLPNDEGPHYPSLARTAGSTPVDPESLADVRQCGACHQEAVKQWQSSAHAHASFDNPWYRASVEALRSDVSFKASKHCGGCHDPVLLLGNAMEKPIDPADRLVNSGVTCLVCHSVRSPTSDGNASYTLNTDPVPFPVDGDEASLARHRERLAADSLRTPALCASCHRGFLGRHTGIDHHLSGMDDPGSWRGSAFANTRSNTPEAVAAQTCAGCHMRAEATRFEEVSAKEGKIKSHRFAGAHTPLAAQLKDARQSEALSAQLQHSVVVDVPVAFRDGQPVLTSELRDLTPGTNIALDVTLRNTSVGHTFPGGVKDMQDTWVELAVQDASGRELVHAGKDHEKREDDTAFVLRALQVDAQGRPETRHVVTQFGTVAYDHTLPPLGARVVRYSFTVPKDSQGPLQVSARVRHRRHRLEAREFACEATRSARGRAFIAEAKKRGEPVFDGCASEPITEVASVQITLGEAQPTAARPIWQRLYDHALGLSLCLQEHLGEARWSAQLALQDLEHQAQPEPAQRAMLHTLLGRIEGNQGRLQDALTQADRAEALLGDHPSVARVRGDAYARVWQWPAAAEAFTTLTRLAPGDTAAFRDLAKARFSAGDAAGALQAAQSGMALQPRDETLLRVQALSLETLKSPESKAAREAFLFYRDADETTNARIACDKQVPNCRRDREPVVRIDLTPAATMLTNVVAR